MKDATILKTGIIGAAIAAICCATPVLVIALGAVGLDAHHVDLSAGEYGVEVRREMGRSDRVHGAPWGGLRSLRLKYVQMKIDFNIIRWCEGDPASARHACLVACASR